MLLCRKGCFKMSDLIQVNGLYFFPPVFYNKSSDIPDVREVSLVNTSMSQFPFNGDNLFIHDEGYLATYTNDKDISENILNAIFLSTSLLKCQVHRGNKEELDTLKINDVSSNCINMEGTLISVRGFLHFYPKIRKEYPEIIIKKDEFEIIIQLAENIFKSKFKTAIFTFYESYTQYQVGNYTGSFLMGWMTIENYLSVKVEECLQNKGKSQNKIDTLNRKCSASKKLKYLLKNKIISKIDKDNYDHLRTIRNDVIHSNYIPKQTESKECKEAANSIIWKLFKIEGINYSDYINKMKRLSK